MTLYEYNVDLLYDIHQINDVGSEFHKQKKLLEKSSSFCGR